MLRSMALARATELWRQAGVAEDIDARHILSALATAEMKVIEALDALQ